MAKLKTEYDTYTSKKLLINLVEDIFKITDIEYGKIYKSDYAILTINDDEYITYSKIIIKQLKSGSFTNVEVVLKAFYVNDFINKKFHKLYIIGELL